MSYADYGVKEMSGTALFLYGMAWGIQKGYLKAEVYKPVCDRAPGGTGSATGCIPTAYSAAPKALAKTPSRSAATYTKVPDFEDYGTGCFLLGRI